MVILSQVIKVAQIAPVMVRRVDRLTTKIATLEAPKPQLTRMEAIQTNQKTALRMIISKIRIRMILNKMETTPMTKIKKIQKIRKTNLINRTTQAKIELVKILQIMDVQMAIKTEELMIIVTLVTIIRVCKAQTRGQTLIRADLKMVKARMKSLEIKMVNHRSLTPKTIIL